MLATCATAPAAMNWLALDTSTEVMSVAVQRGDQIWHRQGPGGAQASSTLIPTVLELMAQAGLTCETLDAIVLGRGPGSFTGIRAGAATIQGLALATGTPCAGFSSLAMLAMNAFGGSGPVCSLLDARKNEVYAGLYDCSSPIPSPFRPDCVVAPQLLAGRLCDITDQPVLFVGDGALRYRDVLAELMGDRARFAPPSAMNGRAAHGTFLAGQAFLNGCDPSPAALLPTYIRPSEAELNRRSIPRP